MEMIATDTRVESPLPPGEWPRALSSQLPADDDLLPLKQIQLAKVDRLKGGESPEEIGALYDRWKAEIEAERAAAGQTASDWAKDAPHRAFLANLRRSLERHGFTASADMPEPEMSARLAELEQKRRAERRQEEASSSVAWRRARADTLFADAGCPTRATIDIAAAEDGGNADWLRVRDLLVDQAGYANGYLVALCGIRGTGKTVLAASVIRRCCEALMTCRYVKAMNLFRDLRRPYTPVARGKAGLYEDEVVAAWVEPDLLVIDELHQRGDTDSEQNNLINLLDQRYDARSCTVLIANLKVEDFAAAMGDSIVSRIHQIGEAQFCDWPTYRKSGHWRQSPGSEPRVPSGGRANRAN